MDLNLPFDRPSQMHSSSAASSTPSYGRSTYKPLAYRQALRRQLQELEELEGPTEAKVMEEEHLRPRNAWMAKDHPHGAISKPEQDVARPQKELSPEDYAKPFCKFLTDNPTVFHAVSAVSSDLESQGYKKLSERDSWKLEKGGKYFIERNGSSLVAFAIGDKYEAGNGAAILAGHIDALTAKRT